MVADEQTVKFQLNLSMQTIVTNDFFEVIAKRKVSGIKRLPVPIDMKFPIHIHIHRFSVDIHGYIHIHRRLSLVHVAPKFLQNRPTPSHLHDEIDVFYDDHCS